MVKRPENRSNKEKKNKKRETEEEVFRIPVAMVLRNKIILTRGRSRLGKSFARLFSKVAWCFISAVATHASPLAALCVCVCMI